MSRAKLTLLLALALVSAALAAPRELVVFHLNDAHGYIFSRPEQGTTGGGFALLAGALERGRREAAARGAATLFLFGGDMFQGTAVVEATRGECMVDLFNRLGLDGACLGNHEFDYGTKLLAERLAAARYPVLATNVRTAGAAARFLKGTALVERAGLRIGLVGCTTTETPAAGFPENTAGFSFLPPASVVPAALDELRAQGASVLIAVTHDGVEDDRVLARASPGLALIVGGHSHTELHEPVVEAGVPIVQAGEYMRWLGEVRLALDEHGRPRGLAGYRLIRLAEPEVPRDAGIQRLVDGYVAPVEASMREVVGELAIDLPMGVRGDDSPVAAVVADAYREAAGAEIALVNRGGVRRALARGPVTVGAVIEVVPFANTLVTLRLDGATLRAMLEKGVSGEWIDATPEARVTLARHAPGAKLAHAKVPVRKKAGMLQPSGLRYAFDPRRPEGQRVVDARVGKRALEDGRLYTVACTNFLAGGGDGYSEILAGRDRRDFPLRDRDMLIRYFAKRRPLTRAPTGTLRNLANVYDARALTEAAGAH